MTIASIETDTVFALPLEYEEATFPSWDGAELFYRAWLPSTPAQRAVLLFHRGHEHSGRFQQFVDELALGDTAFFAWDARGHGRSPGERGYAHSFSSVVRDLDCFVRFLADRYDIPMQQMVALGHSVGAVALAAWVHDYAPPIRAMVLATPAFRVKLYVPFALPALRLRMLFGDRSSIKSYVRPRMLTHDPEQADAYQRDSLISRNIATNILLDLHDTSTRLLRDAGAIHVPTLLLRSGSDWVVKNSAQRRFFQRLSSPVKEMETYPGFYHAILHEHERHRPIDRIRAFITERFERDGETPSLLRADSGGCTRQEYERLSKPLPLWSPKRWSFALQRLSMKTLCRLSDGVRLGWRTGFDSGQSLDAVYRNRPHGITPIGTLIDRFYLSAIGWRGIRLRKQYLCELLDATIRRLRAAGDPVRIVDIASGPGRYLLETLKRFEGHDLSATLRDRSPRELDAGRRLAAEMGIASATYADGDAFDRASLAAIQPQPNLAIVSGLYELFPDNDKIQASLAGLADALTPGGYLIYTNQPWHPQVEMIARVLINRDGRPWIMRRRTQAEMDELLRTAGFEKLDMRIDPYGIFTVSVARRTVGRPRQLSSCDPCQLSS
jgi:alpha-beta hydrolase superfamily lysophospholipase/SAM-dependent methyltransferase